MFWPWHSRPQPTLTYRESDPSSHQLRIVYLSPGIILVLIHDLSTTVATLDIQVEHPLHTPTKPKAILTSVSKSLAAHRSSLVEKKKESGFGIILSKWLLTIEWATFFVLENQTQSWLINFHSSQLCSGSKAAIFMGVIL